MGEKISWFTHLEAPINSTISMRISTTSRQDKMTNTASTSPVITHKHKVMLGRMAVEHTADRFRRKILK